MLSERPRSGVSEARKITKSAMEKKRRARINTCLVELKTILGGMLSHKSERFDKMEKADILEMTVKYVKQLQKKSDQQNTTTNKDEDYKNGVNSCISEVIKYIASSNSCDSDIKAKLLDHLANRLSGSGSETPQQKCDDKLEHGDSTNPMLKEIESDNNNNKPVQSPLNINVPPSSPSTLTLSPGSITNQVTFQGQYALQTSPVVNSLQQTSPLVSNIPVTIIVPANFYPSTTGTTCVIPLNIPATSIAQTMQNTESSNGPLTKTKPTFSTDSIVPKIPICVPQQTTVLSNNSLNKETQPLGRPLCIKSLNTVGLKEGQSGVKNSDPVSQDRMHYESSIKSLERRHSESENLWRPW